MQVFSKALDFAKANRKLWAVFNCDWSLWFNLWQRQRKQEGDVWKGRYADYQGKGVREWQHVNNMREASDRELLKVFFLQQQQQQQYNTTNQCEPVRMFTLWMPFDNASHKNLIAQSFLQKKKNTHCETFVYFHKRCEISSMNQSQCN